MIVQIVVSIDSSPYSADLSVCESAEAVIKPEFLHCLDIGKLAENLAARAFREYLGGQARQEEKDNV